MKLVLDASMALAWLIMRADPAEAALATRGFDAVSASGAEVPALWYSEVANTLLVFERGKKLSILESVNFLADMALLSIKQDDLPCASLQQRVLGLGRIYGLTAYDAAYLELVLRTGYMLATFDRQLADAARQAGARVFGDAE